MYVQNKSEQPKRTPLYCAKTVERKCRRHGPRQFRAWIYVSYSSLWWRVLSITSLCIRSWLPRHFIVFPELVVVLMTYVEETNGI